MKGFTLIELIVVVAIIGVLAVIGTPMYKGYLETADDSVIKNNLLSIYLQQQEYLTSNNVYYSTAASCTESSAAINTNLFSGTQIITANGYNYCILQVTTTDFDARAEQISGSKTFSITNAKVTSW